MVRLETVNLVAIIQLFHNLFISSKNAIADKIGCTKIENASIDTSANNLSLLEARLGGLDFKENLFAILQISTAFV